MAINPNNPPDQVTNPNAALPVYVVTAVAVPNPANPPDQITIPSGAIPVYIVPQP